MKTGYYIVKFYNHEERKVFYFNGNSFESFKSDPFIHDEIESTEPLNIQSPSPSLSAEQEAREYAEDKVNKDGTSHAYTGQQVFEMLVAAHLAGLEYFRKVVLGILIENAEACKNLVDEDKVRSAQEMVNEIYEDMISIIGKAPFPLSVK